MSSATPQPESAGQASSDRGVGSRRSQIILSLTVAIVILAGTWFIGGREGFSQIGKGGINQQLLPKVGDVAPDFTAYDLTGRQVSLSDYHGTPVWLNFWGSWCPPCRAEMPDIQEAYEQLAPDGLVLLAVSLDEPPLDAALFAARNGSTFTILTDEFRQGTGAAFPIYNFPTHIFIDADGVVHRIVLAEMDADEALQYGHDLIESSN